jgi:CHASE3 domain sensor protein
MAGTLHKTYLLHGAESFLRSYSAASQEIPRIFGTRRFLTVHTSARHLSLSWANSIQSPQLPT